MRHADAYYFNKIYILFYGIRQEHTKITVSFPDK